MQIALHKHGHYENIVASIGKCPNAKNQDKVNTLLSNDTHKWMNMLGKQKIVLEIH